MSENSLQQSLNAFTDFKQTSRYAQLVNTGVWYQMNEQDLYKQYLSSFMQIDPKALFYFDFYIDCVNLRVAEYGERPTKLEHALILAYAAAIRSEDPKRKVGAVACDHDGRFIAAGYNGLPGKVKVQSHWWDSDDNRRSMVIHAETNLCSLTSRGDVETVAVTTCPCGPCALNLVAHGVKRVVFGEFYSTDMSGFGILETFGVETFFIPNLTKYFLLNETQN